MVLKKPRAGDLLPHQLRAPVHVVTGNAKQRGRCLIGIDRLSILVEKQNRLRHICHQEIMQCHFQEDRPVFDRKEIQKDTSDCQSDHGTVNRPVQQHIVIFQNSYQQYTQEYDQILFQIQRGTGEDPVDIISGDHHQEHGRKCQMDIVPRP